MELMEFDRNAWRYSCEDCGWRSPAVHGPGKEGKDRAYVNAMRRWNPVYDGYQCEHIDPVKIWHAAGGGRTK